MVRVGLVGCGTIGSQLALALERTFAHTAKIVALHDADPTHAVALQRRLASHPLITSLAQLIHKSQLVLEAASVDAAALVLRHALRQRRDVFIMSVGALLSDGTWIQRARRRGMRVYIPSGALAGLDGIKAMAVGTIRSVSLTSRKPPHALSSAPYVLHRRINLNGLKRPRVVFDGSPADVVKAFPQNTNVAAALALASGSSGKRARIRVIADPSARVNAHEVEVEGDCGRISCRIESRPSPNPKTSELAVRSAIATLARVFDPISVGT